MLTLQLTDFSIDLQTEFKVPVLREQARLMEIVEKLTEAFSDVLSYNDVSLVAEDELFDYELTVPLFNGAAEILITAQRMSASFKNGKNLQALELISKCLSQIYPICVTRSIRGNQLTFNAFGIFDSLQSYEKFMAKFINPDLGITSGGTTLAGSGRTFSGSIRFSTEKAIALDTGLFLSGQISTVESIGLDLGRKIAERVIELAKTQGLEITLAS